MYKVRLRFSHHPFPIMFPDWFPHGATIDVLTAEQCQVI